MMKFSSKLGELTFTVDLEKGVDISLPVDPAGELNAFYIPAPKFEALRVGTFVGSVVEGGSANCENLLINAHGNGTHTECVGHLSRNRISIHDCLKSFHHIAQLISVEPILINGDYIITLQDVLQHSIHKDAQALVIRTLPNFEGVKKNKNYSGTNPCYLEPKLCAWIRENHIKHLLVDLPSVDREEDQGQLLAHKAFWNYPEAPRLDMTITEFIFVPENLADGLFLLNLQIASLMTDASPSKPVLYPILF